MRRVLFWATVEGATKYGDDRTRPVYVAAYENGGRGTVTDYQYYAKYLRIACVSPAYRLRITYVSRCFGYILVTPFIYFYTFLVYIERL